MIAKYIETQILSHFPFEPTHQQEELIKILSQFLTSSVPRRSFILMGYAGTGKTSVVAALVKAMKQLELQTVLLAPTGRAAKVLSAYAQSPAFTIHKKIYRQKSVTETKFVLAENLMKNTLFIVDEASMISNIGGESEFGSGFLLDDLFQFVYQGAGCYVLMLGDVAQLPPVNQSCSVALEATRHEMYGIHVEAFTLTQVVRQALHSGILYHATVLRKALEDQLTTVMPRFNGTAFADMKPLKGMELIDEVTRSYYGVGKENTIIITQSNKMANYYNKGIRHSVLLLEDEISNGDLLMVTRNNYFWSQSHSDIEFMANGDILRVNRMGKSSQMYGFRFVDLELESLDFGWQIHARIWLDCLYSDSPMHTAKLSNQLFEAVAEDYQDIGNKRERYKQMMQNPYLNALQVKFAYAITCHKAQGGQWDKVFVDVNRRSVDAVDESYYRWLYTAITRAKQQVFLVNYSLQ